jgi:hypothetical protein
MRTTPHCIPGERLSHQWAALRIRTMSGHPKRPTPTHGGGRAWPVSAELRGNRGPDRIRGFDQREVL